MGDDWRCMSDVYQRRRNDNKPGSSIEDDRVLAIVEDGFIMNANGNLLAPLPFRDDVKLPDNRHRAIDPFKVPLQASD